MQTFLTVHQFHDKIDPMLESLDRIAERLRQPPSISVEVDKIKEQIAENKAVSVDLEKLQPSYETLKQRGEEMIARSEGADKDISAKGMQRIESLCFFSWIPYVYYLIECGLDEGIVAGANQTYYIINSQQ